MQSSLNAITKLDMSSFKTQEERVKAVMNAITGLSDKQVELILNNTNLHDSIKDAVIQTQAQKIATDATTASQVKQISTTEALSVKMTTLGATIKAALPWLIPVALLAGAVTAYAAYQKKIKETAESAEECAASLKEFHDTTSKNLKTVESLSDRYEELNKGVSNLGKNISLTTDEYNEYQSICNQLADIMPDLVDYYDQTGTAILKTTGRAEDLTRAYKEQAKAAANAFLMSNDKENSPKSINDNYDNYFEQKFTLGNSLESIENRRGRYQSSINIKDALSKDYDEFISMLNQFKGTDLYSYFKKILEKGGYDITEINKENFSNIRNVLSSYLDTLETELGERVTGIQSILKNQLFGSDEYWNMDEDAANAVSKLISNIDSEFINANNLNTLSGQNEFVNSLVKNIYKSQDDFAEALASLFSSDTTINEVTSALNILGSIIGVNIDELIRMLGLENEQDAKRILSDSIRSISEKHQGVPGATLMTGYNDEDIAWLEDKTKDFTDEQAIMWASVTDGIYGAAEAWEAWEKHLANIPEVDKNKFAISTEDAEALSDYQSKIDSISDSLANKHNLTAGDITSLLTDFSEYADIWEMYGVNEYGEGDIESALEAIALKLRDEAADKVPQMRSYIEGMYESVLNPKGNSDKLQLEVDSLELILKDVRDGKVLDEVATAKLINKYPELADAVQVLTDGYSFEEDAIIDLTNTKIASANEAIAWDIEQTEQEIENVKARIEARAMETRARQRELQELAKNGIYQAVLGENGETLLSDESANEDLTKLQELLAHLQELKDIYNTNLETLGKNTDPEIFNWYETAMERIQRNIDNLGNTVDNVYEPWEERQNALNDLIDENNKLLDVQRNAYETYYSKAEGVQLDAKYKELIRQGYRLEDGNLGVESIVDEEDVKLIEEFTKWWELYLTTFDAANETQRNLNEQRKQGIEFSRLQSDGDIARLEEEQQRIQDQIDLNSGKGTNEQYTSLITKESKRKELLEARLLLEEEHLKTLDLNSEAYLEQESIINDCKDKIAECNKNTKEWNMSILKNNAERYSSIRENLETELGGAISDTRRKGILEDPNGLKKAINDEYNALIKVAQAEKDVYEVAKLELERKQALADVDQQRLDLIREIDDAEISRLERNRTEIQNQIDLNGGKGTAEQYGKLISIEKSISSERSKDLERETKFLLEIKKTNGENSSEYREQEKIVNDIADDIAECEKNTKDWGQELLNLPIEAINDAIDGLNKKLDANQSAQEEVDSIIAGAVAYIQDEIDAQEELKQGIQDQIDALQEANDERERTLALEKAKYELERAQSQRVKKVYKGEGKGFVYEQDQEAVRDAQENLSNLEFEETIHALEKQMEYYDDIIADLQEMQDAWSNIRSDAEDYLNIEKAIEAIGVEGIFDTAKVEEYSQAMRGLLQTEQQINEELKTWQAFLAEVEEISSKYTYKVFTLEEAIDAVKSAGDEYLPQLEEFQTLNEEGAYVADSEKVKNVIDEIMRTYLDGYAELVDGAEGAGDDAEDAMSEVVKAAMDDNDLIEEDAKKTNDAIETDAGNTIGAITTKLQDELKIQKGHLETFKSDVLTIFGDSYNDVKDGLLDALTAFSEAVSDSCSNLEKQITAIEKKLNDTEGALDDLSEKEDKIFVADNGTPSEHSMIQLQAYHTGIEKGLVGEKDAGEGLKRVALRKLEPDEIPALLKLDEAVLTQLQQQNVMSNIGAAYRAGINTAVIKNNSSTPVVQNINLTLPNVTNESGYNRLVQELQGLQLDALQFAKKR